MSFTPARRTPGSNAPSHQTPGQSHDASGEAAPEMTYGRGGWKGSDSWDALPPAALDQVPPEVNAGPPFAELVGEPVTRRRRNGGTESYRQEQRAWRLTRNHLVTAVLTRPLQRKGDGRLAPAGTWTATVETYDLAAGSGKRVTGQLDPPPIVRDDGTASATTTAAPGDDFHDLWVQLPGAARTTVDKAVPLKQSVFTHAESVMWQAEDGGAEREQELWYVRRSHTAVAAVHATRRVAADDNGAILTPTRQWSVDTYTAPIAGSRGPARTAIESPQQKALPKKRRLGLPGRT